MWNCRICEHKSGRRGNIIRHMKLVHSIDDRDCKNAYKDSNKASRKPSYGESRNETPVCSNGLQSRIMGSGKQLSEERYPNMIPPEPMTDLQDGGYLSGHQPRMYEEEDKPMSNPVEGLYSPEQIENFGDDLRRKKCHILDCVLDTFPEHLKTKAKSMCDVLKCKDRLFIHPSHKIVIDGEVDRGSNIRDYIMDSLIEPPVPGTPKFKMLEKENERLKRNLAYYEKALARARGLSRCRKFESIIDGTVDRCDFSDVANSDESDGDDDTDGTEEDDEIEYEDDEEEEEDDEDDEEEYEEDDEPSRKRKKKN